MKCFDANKEPLAQKKLSKKVFKAIKKASKNRGHVKRGVKEVVKGLRKGDKGWVTPRPGYFKVPY